ncbi:CCE_0567 family metalloprotein [Pseudomonas oryzae]|uniref:Rop-like n=1 Tax=Pseudomonas oryzae TaxID=1392877 RepID=A0A1H1LS27_9PSED|nr:CCE_0567 family metalloprotein [Pseudomonas oryzae]SDR77408.1 Rop-like [Pseudomonas oryzae]
MNEDEIKTLKKEVSQKKRIATDWAAQIHDLVEDRLLTDYQTLPELARQTHQACLDWAEAKARLEASGAE